MYNTINVYMLLYYNIYNRIYTFGFLLNPYYISDISLFYSSINFIGKVYIILSSKYCILCYAYILINYKVLNYYHRPS